MHTNCFVFKTEQGQHICLRVDICLCWALFHESQVSVTDLRQILQFTGKKWGHQYIVRYWRCTAFITRWLSLWSLGFLCPFCFGPFSVPAGLSLVCFLLQLVLKRWHQNVIKNSSIKRNKLHCSVTPLFFLPSSPISLTTPCWRLQTWKIQLSTVISYHPCSAPLSRKETGLCCY